jgi:hypothetical protein
LNAVAYISAKSISGSSPAVVEKRTFKVLSVRTVDDEEARAACSPSEIAQLYAALLHYVVAGSVLMVTDTALKGGLLPEPIGKLGLDFRGTPLL